MEWLRPRAVQLALSIGLLFALAPTPASRVLAARLRAGVDALTIKARGIGALAQMMSLVFFGDYVSGYLALLYGVDPTPTTVIDELKAWLADQE